MMRTFNREFESSKNILIHINVNNNKKCREIEESIDATFRLQRVLALRISLLRFFKTFHQYLPYANFELFISLVQFFGKKIAKKLH